MHARIWILLTIAIAAATPAGASQRAGVTLTHFETLERISVQADSSTQRQKPGEIGPVTLGFDALGRRFSLELLPNAALWNAIPANQRSLDAVPYRGQLAGVPDSWARVVLVDGVPSGLIWDGNELIALERPGDGLVESSGAVAYRLADVVVAPGALSCAGGPLPATGAAIFEKVVAGLATGLSQGPGAISEINIGAVGDYEFTSSKGANAQSAIMARLNIVDGIFSQQLGVQITVPVIETFTDINDPFGDTTVPGDLLMELGAYRLATPSQNSQGLTHLYTGRDLDGSTVGIAYTGALCSSGFGAGLSEGNAGQTFDALIAAHEIGHNFGAPHDGVMGSPCEAEPPTYIMATTLNGSQQFSACSIAEMQDDVAAASCISALPATDISLSFSEPSTTVLLGNIARATIDVVNNGIQVANNVAVDITLPGIVTFVDASGGSAVCTSGAGTVNCQLGDVQGSSGMTIAVTANTPTVGSGTYTATVTADADERPGNNQDSLLLSVDPAVNLAINPPGSATITVDQSTTIMATLDNLSTLDATNVTLSVSLDAGLRADSATWSIGTCTVAAQQVDCQAGQFDSMTSSTFSLGVTGVLTGNRDFSVLLASVEADADTADNSFDGKIRVNSVGGNGNDEGGGSLGWLLVFVLGSCALVSLRRREYQVFARERFATSGDTSA